MDAKIGKMDQTILKYRVRGNSISKSYSLEQFLNTKSLTKLYKNNQINNTDELIKLINNNKKLATDVEKEKFNNAGVLYYEVVKDIKDKKLLLGLLKFIKSMSISKYYFAKNFDLVRYKIAKYN